MKVLGTFCAVVAVAGLSACEQPVASQSASDACGAFAYANLVGGPSSAVMALDIPGTSRHYGSQERVATNDPSRLNFVHSGTAFEAVADPSSTVVRAFCR